MCALWVNPACSRKVTATSAICSAVSWHGIAAPDWDAIHAADPQGDLYKVWLKELYAKRPVADTA